jgi:methylmalonyl-CoA mutase N-terminal domain/subunit
VAIDTLADMEILFKDIPLDKVTTSMTINAPAIVLFAMYIALAENQGIDPVKLEGTIQNDILKEYIAQNEWIYPPESSLRLITDTIVYSARHIPKWHPVSISGYHIREAGSTAIQELAFTLYDGLTYVEEVIKAGLDIDEFAPRLSFFFNSHNDFFEEIAKFRAARRIWAREIKKRYNPGDPHSMVLRFHTQTAGCTLTAQQPMNNIIRVTIQALAGVLGGTQSLHTDSLDETLALPSEEAVMIALRTQQIIAEESGVTNTIDPLGGSYYIEALTNEMEKGAHEYFKKLDDLGGMVSAIEKSFPQNEIREASYTYQKEIDNNERMIVGVNKFTTKEEQTIETLKIEPEIEKKQVEKLQAFKKKRDINGINKALEDLKKTAESGESVLPPIIKALKLYATVGDVCNAMKEVFGEYKEPGII